MNLYAIVNVDTVTDYRVWFLFIVLTFISFPISFIVNGLPVINKRLCYVMLCQVVLLQYTRVATGNQTTDNISVVLSQHTHNLI